MKITKKQLHIKYLNQCGLHSIIIYYYYKLIKFRSVCA